MTMLMNSYTFLLILIYAKLHLISDTQQVVYPVLHG